MPQQAHRFAAIQMVSGPDVASNLAAARDLVAEAAQRGAQLCALPEYFCLMGLRDADKVGAREPQGAGPIQEFLARTAAEFGVWLIGGTLPLACEDPARVRNACLVYDERGRNVARYDKIHLFGYAGEIERYDEASTIEPGDRAVAVDSPFGRLGLSVCYDVRFPELYRALGPVDVLFVPSAFTVPTGRAHWETLLRARAIENLAYVVAPAQGGRHPSGRRTHGHSMIVDPWGTVLECLPEGSGVLVAAIDPSRIAEVRASLPALSHRARFGGGTIVEGRTLLAGLEAETAARRGRAVA
ncbi:MAG: carbon-nitrogen hydrolase family protein [Burkholderiales bacterium]|nr:carbon-nitrogen hydrolase family protein [Burkholderiales bacterium]